MLEFYPQIKTVHLWLAMASGLLFAIRGLCALLGMRWPRWRVVKWTSYTIDTALLTAAAMLFTILPGGMFANGWLALKVALVVVYIVLGILAMRAQRSTRQRLLLYLAALAVYAQIYGIARAHHPAGWLAPMFA